MKNHYFMNRNDNSEIQETKIRVDVSVLHSGTSKKGEINRGRERTLMSFYGAS